MAATVHVADGDEQIEPTTSGDRDSNGDPEKRPATTEQQQRYGDQIPHEMLEELAPNGEGDYLLERINAMGEDEALAIVAEAVAFHADDWNFPSEMRDRMTRLLAGPKLYGEWYDRDLRIDAVLMKYSSPYPGVRAVAEILDDTSVPVETARAYFLGVMWAVIGTFMSTFFTSRFPGISETGPAACAPHSPHRVVGGTLTPWTTAVQA